MAAQTVASDASTKKPDTRRANPANPANYPDIQRVNGANVDANSLRTQPDRTWDSVIPPPEASPLMFYGLLGELAQAAAKGKEVNPMAAQAAAMCWLSAAIGRNYVIEVGDHVHHLLLFTLHVGRTSKGGKGLSLGLLNRVIDEIKKIDEKLTPQQHSGGLSTREGLAKLIHDGYQQANGEDVPAINDKRMSVTESEFANVLAQSKRDGNTLSTALRDAWDGVSIKPATKSASIAATNPHIALHGQITPIELREKIARADLSNGFCNRFLIILAERTCDVALPEKTPDEVVLVLARRFAEIIRHGLANYPERQEKIVLKLSARARELYRELYPSINGGHPGGELISGLIARRPPMLLRIAGLFAVTDMAVEISAAHVTAAAAWISYYADSVHLIFAEATNREQELALNENSDKIVDWLTGAGEWCSRTRISKECFRGHLPKSRLDAALQRLLINKAIERREVETGGTTRATEYRLKISEPARLRGDFAEGFAP